MPELILHHYDESPFSEKVRLCFGLKAIAWRSVIIPMVAPKPDLAVLTGGYRHTPVMQIGADIFCDTRSILAQLDRCFPERLLSAPQTSGLSAAIEAWAERDLFWPIARYLTGMNAELHAGFHADRAALRGKGAPSVARIEATARTSLALVEAQLPLVDSMARNARPYLLSDTVSQADLAVYHALWFLSALPLDCSAVLRPYPAVASWMARIAALGHGSSRLLTAREAIEVARAAQPAAIARPVWRSAYDPELGSAVSIRPDGYYTDDVAGVLIHLDRDSIVVQRDDPRAGRLWVHFPRIGYIIRKSA